MHPPVFITGRFRSGSTLLWNVFRQVGEAVSFYEPLHESLLQMIRSRTLPQPEHYHVRTYFESYPLETDLAKHHDSTFGVCRLHLEADEPHLRLRDYLTFLINRVNENRIPVLQCNRIDFRLPWIRANFPKAVIIHLYRSAREQWISSVDGNSRFADNDVDADPFLITTWARDLCEQFPFLARPFIRHSYERFYYLWKLSYLIGSRQADLSVSFEDILCDDRTVLWQILDLAGVEPRRWIEHCSGLVVKATAENKLNYRDEQWFHGLEEKCETTLKDLGLNQQYGTRKLAEIITGNLRYQELYKDHRASRWALQSAQMANVDLKNALEEKEKVINYLRSKVGRTQEEREFGTEAKICSASGKSELAHCGNEPAFDSRCLSLLLGLPVASFNHLFVYRLMRFLKRSPQKQSTKKWLSFFLQRTRYFLGRIKNFLRRWIIPRLGLLHHHASIPLQIPPHYFETKCPPGNAPTISIVTPSLNHGKYLELAARSVIAQNYPKLEYVIQDGGSNDETERALQRLRPFVHHIESRKDRGQAHAINLGFAHTTGEIMAWLNSDDLLLPGALNHVANVFLDNPNVDVIYSHRVLIDSQGWEIGRWVLPKHEEEGLKWADFIPQETLFWRRKIWERAGGHVKEDMQYAFDWEMLLRFQLAGARMMRVPRFFGAFRVHEEQKTIALFYKSGQEEMGLLRKHYHGRGVSSDEIGRHIHSYLTRRLFTIIYIGLGCCATDPRIIDHVDATSKASFL